MPLVGKRIATTADNFRKMVEKKYLLVDKTLMIKDFIDSTDDATLITRPRRFGKTLNLSMLQYFFAATVNGESTQGLFKGFAIAQVEEGQFLKDHQGQYPVIFITFKDVKESSYQAAVNQINVLIQELYREHKHLLKSDKIDDYDRAKFKKYLDGSVNNETLQRTLKFLSKFLHKAHGKKVIILIDEYDSPLTKAYEHGFLDELSNFMCNVFGTALKGNGHLEKGLMIGILRISKSSMLSGLNNLDVFTVFEKNYQQYFGFTEAEMEELIKPTGATESLEVIRKYYNGYKMGEVIVYNPWSAMKFFDKKELAPYWVLTSNDKLLKDALLNSSKETKQQLGDLMQEKTIEGEIDINLRYEDLMEKSTTLWTLLLFCGYLTVESSKLSKIGTTRVCQLRIPNQEVMRQYNQVFTEWLKEKMGVKYDSFLKNLVEGHIDEFTTNLTGYLFSCTSSHDFQAESDYHCFILGLLASITDTHLLSSNKEYGAGRPDCLLIPYDTTKTQGIVLEFKYLHFKKGDDRKDVALLRDASHNSAKEGLEQIDTRGYKHAFNQHKHITNVLEVSISFSNRIVSSAYKILQIVNGNEVGPQPDSPVIIFDADETKYPKSSGMIMTDQRQETKKRPLSKDQEESEDKKLPKQKKRKVQEGTGQAYPYPLSSPLATQGMFNTVNNMRADDSSAGTATTPVPGSSNE